MTRFDNFRVNGDYWPKELGTTLLAVDVVVEFLLLCCIIFQTQFRWIADTSPNDRLRNWGYPIAVLIQISSYVVNIVDLGFHMADAEVPQSYLRIYILSNNLWRLADILILAIVYRTIAQSSKANLARRLFKWHRAIISILALGAFAVCGLNIWLTVYSIQEKQENPSTEGFTLTSVMFYPFYLLAGLIAGLESLLVMVQSQTKANKIMMYMVIPAVVLHATFIIVHYTLGLQNRSEHFEEKYLQRGTGLEAFKTPSYYFEWICKYFTEIANIFLYGGLAYIGWLRFREDTTKNGIWENEHNLGNASDVPINAPERAERSIFES